MVDGWGDSSNVTERHSPSRSQRPQSIPELTKQGVYIVAGKSNVKSNTLSEFGRKDDRQLLQRHEKNCRPTHRMGRLAHGKTSRSKAIPLRTSEEVLRGLPYETLLLFSEIETLIIQTDAFLSGYAAVFIDAATGKDIFATARPLSQRWTRRITSRY